MIRVKGGMRIMDELKYLQLCGFRRKKKAKGEGGVVGGRESGDSVDECVVLTKPIRSFYPKVSCVEGSSVDGDGGYSFILHYSPDEGYARCEVHFQLEEAEELREKLKDSILKFFYLPDSWLKKIRKARANGQKAWKVRHYPLVPRKAKIYEAFGLEYKKKLADSLNSSVAVDSSSTGAVSGDSAGAGTGAAEIALRNMKVLVEKAASNYSLQVFDLYYEAYKEYHKAVGSGSGSGSSSGSCSKNKAWSCFINEVKKCQDEHYA